MVRELTEQERILLGFDEAHPAQAYAKHYLGDDGQVTTEIYQKPVRYKDAADKWQNSETAFEDEPGFGKKVKKAKHNLRFHNNKLRFGFSRGIYIDYTLPGQTVVSGDTATITEAWTGVDLVYKSLPEGVKADFILKTAGSQSAFSFSVELTAVTATQNGNTLEYVETLTGNVVGRINAPYAVDANGEQGEVALAWDGSAVTFVVDPDWLNDPARAYPVTIDPTTVLQPDGTAGIDTYVSSQTATTNYATAGAMTAGMNFGGYTTRALINFTLTSIPSNALVSSAIMALYAEAVESVTAATHNMHKITSSWVETGPTWDAQPTSEVAATTSASVGAVGWYNYTITALVQAWVNGTVANYGVMIKQSPETGSNISKVYTSSDGATASNRPKLTIIYTTPPAVTITSPNGSQASPTSISNEVTPTLSGGYSDVGGEAQQSAQWQVLTEAGNSVYDSGKTTTSSTSHAVPSGYLSYGAKYQWRWKAWDTTDTESAWSSVGWFICSMTAPTGFLAKSDPTNAQIQLSWSAHAGEALAGYNLYRRKAGDTTWIKQNSSVIAGNSYNDAYAASGVVYEYEVRAVSTTGYESSGSGPLEAAFSRGSVAYLQNGSQVASGAVRYENGYFHNLLSDNQASVETDTTGFSQNTTGAILTRDTTEHWQGVASLKVVTDGTAGSQGSAINITAKANQVYTGSVYVKGSGTIQVTMNGAVVTSVASSVITLTNTWTRYSVTVTANSSGGTINLIAHTNVLEAITFYIDGLQIEEGSTAKQWILPSLGKGITVEEGTTNSAGTDNSFETGVNGFISYGNSTETITSSTDYAFSGTKSLKTVCVAPGTSGYGVVKTISNPTSWQGKTVTLSMKIRGVGSAIGKKVYPDIYYTTGDINSSAITLTGEWQTLSCSGTIPSSGVTGLYIYWLSHASNPLVAGDIVYADCVQFEEKAYATSWTDQTRAAETLTIPTAGVFTKGNWNLDFCFEPISPQVVTGRFAILWQLFIDGSNIYGLTIHPTGRPYLAVMSGGVEKNTYSGTEPILSPGNKYKLTIKGNGTTISLFLNGTKIGLGDVAYTEPVGILPTNMYIGSNSSGLAQANGIYDDLRISSRARTDAEILANYSANVPLPVDEYTTAKMDFDGSLTIKQYMGVNFGDWWLGTTKLGGVTDFGYSLGRKQSIQEVWGKDYPVIQDFASSSGKSTTGERLSVKAIIRGRDNMETFKTQWKATTLLGLRDPFGRVWKVKSVGDIGADQIKGTGQADHYVSFELREVAS